MKHQQYEQSSPPIFINRIHKIILICSILIYIVSCFMPCLLTRTEKIYGFLCLFVGEISIITDIWLFLIWCSNMIYFYVVIRYFRNKEVHFFLPTISLIMAISMLFHNYIDYDIRVPIIRYLLGYYLWIASYVLVLIIYILRFMGKTNRI